MQGNPIRIEIFDMRQRLSTSIFVDKISDNIYRAVENEMFDCRLTFGTVFETRINKEGKHEIVGIVKDSDYITKRFLLTSQFNQSEYKLLGDEIIKQGGYWQVDFGGIATINLPRDCKLDLEEIFKNFNFYPTYILDV